MCRLTFCGIMSNFWQDPVRRGWGGGGGGGAGGGAYRGPGQGLTLVHFLAQLEPCLTQENTLHGHPNNPLTPPEHGLHNPYAHPLSYMESA